jgi:hypothetical protein
LQNAWDGAVRIFNTIVSFVTGLGARLLRGAGNIWGWLTDGLRGAVNLVIGLLNDIIGALNRISFNIPNIPGLPGRGTKFGINIPLIPKLAEGGIVRPKNGGTLAMIAEAGRTERVEPLDAQGLSVRDRAIIKFLAGKQGEGTNLTFKVYPSEKMSEADLAAAISRQVGFMIRKGGV